MHGGLVGFRKVVLLSEQFPLAAQSHSYRGLDNRGCTTEMHLSILLDYCIGEMHLLIH